MSANKLSVAATLFLCVFTGTFLLSRPAFPDDEVCSIVKLNGSSVWYPISLREAGSEILRGVFPDVAREIFKRLNVPVDVGDRQPWSRLQVLLENGKLDVLAGAYLTPERERLYDISSPVMKEQAVVFVRKDMPAKPQSLEDLVGLRGLAPFGASFGKKFDEYAEEKLTIQRQSFDDFAMNMRLLSEDKADYLIETVREGRRMIEELEADDVIEVLPWPASDNTLHFMFSKSSPCVSLFNDFNQELNKLIQSGELEAMVAAAVSALNESQ
ncbi:substrate-binding periplasmic protein [Roseibium sp.]|uniref:substrate-binding periplasmic protein n=1 Tax=Roseibium sp. TaxID=1936156 RepID=UPI003D105B59